MILENQFTGGGLSQHEEPVALIEQERSLIHQDAEQRPDSSIMKSGELDSFSRLYYEGLQQKKTR